MKAILSTSRVILREMNGDDAEKAYQLNSDPDVLRYTGDEPFKNIAEALHFLNNYDHYHRYGFGRWAVIRKEDQQFLGWCGLKYDPSKNEFDIGFRFFKMYWNNGYATESALACLNWGFEKKNLPMIVGRAMKQNLASIAVLRKIGLEFWKEDTCGGEAALIFRKMNPNSTTHNGYQ